MIDAAVYAEPRSFGTLRRWLETVGRGRPTAPITAAAHQAKVRNLARKYEHLETEPRIVPEADEPAGALGELIEQRGLRRVVMPLTLEDRKMRHAPALRIPRLDKYFDVFRRLWRCGFREFELFTLYGSRVFRIPHMLDEFIDRHKGERAFIVGNGPSLNQTDMSKLADEITFGSNRCYLGFKDWGYQFTYWGCTDRIQIEDYAAEYEQNLPPGMVRFFPFEYLPFFDPGEACPINQSFQVLDEPGFATSPELIYMGNTITYSLIQIAALMGCDPIVLVGTDHSYNLKDVSPEERAKDRTPAERRRIERLNRLKRITGVERIQRLAGRVREGGDGNGKSQFWTQDNASGDTHFNSQYTKNKHFAMPRPRLAENAFRSAARYAEQRGIRILNATPGTQLRELPQVEFESLF